MTEAEKALLEFAMRTGIISNYSERVEELRAAVLKERLPDSAKRPFMDAYKARVRASERIKAVMVEFGIDDDTPLNHWREEAKLELQAEDAK